MKYKVGDKVRVKSLEWYNDNKDKYSYVKCVHENFTKDMSKYCGDVVTIKRFYFSSFNDTTTYNIAEDDGSYTWTDDMFEGLAEDTILPVVFENIVFPNENYADKVELCLGNDYEIVVEDGRTFVQKKKPKYPMTYEECCGVLGISYDYPDIKMVSSKEYCLYSRFIRLIRCRDAYWKITGDWKPDCNNDVYYFYTIKYNGTHIRLYNYNYTQEYAILAFPTEEMRDAFYENFKDLIEKCKELL